MDEVRISPAGDGFYAALKRVEDDPLELLQAACEALRLLRRVLKQLRTAVRAAS
jgi:hypothetical protein